MEKSKLLPTIIAIIIGIILGVAVVSKQAKDPLMKEMLTQQKEILGKQSSIEEKLSSSSGGVMLDTNISSLIERQKKLEARINVLENQWKGLQEVLKQAKAAPPGPPAEDPNKVYTIDVAHSPVFGPKDAPVTIVEFVDFQCPFCARFHPPIVEAAKAYPKEVNYMIKNFPLSFHPQAKPAAKAAFAAGEQGKYFEMADALLENGKNLSEDTFKKLAKDLGLNEKKFWNDYTKKDAEWEKLIQEDMKLGASANVRGTPTMYINGKKTRARDFASFKKEIEAILNNK